jgi:hypothetical protein
MNKNLTELLRTIFFIAEYHHHDGNLNLTVEKWQGVWKVSFLKRLENDGYLQRVEAGTGQTFKEALERACLGETEKIQSSLDHGQEVIKCLKSIK